MVLTEKRGVGFVPKRVGDPNNAPTLQNCGYFESFAFSKSHVAASVLRRVSFLEAGLDMETLIVEDK